MEDHAGRECSMSHYPQIGSRQAETCRPAILVGTGDGGARGGVRQGLGQREQADLFTTALTWEGVRGREPARRCFLDCMLARLRCEYEPGTISDGEAFVV